RRGDNLATRAAWIEVGVAGDAPLHDLAQRGQESARLSGRNDAGQRLFDQLVRTEAQEREDGIVGLQDFSLEIRHEHRVGRVLDQALEIGRASCRETAVTQVVESTGYLTVRVTEGGGIGRRGDALAARESLVEPDHGGDA